MSTTTTTGNELVWYVTGASKGLGLAFVKRLLESGQKVVATSRSKESLNKLVGADSDKFLALQVDLANEDSVKDSIEKSVAAFSRIDVIVNNAGFGLCGSVEEMSDKELRSIMDINFFGLMNVLRHGTKVLREQKSGFVFNISSIAGMYGPWPGLSAYTGSKFAVDGLTESYKTEVQPFGIKVCTINPGYFRTDFLSNDSLQIAAKKIDGYHSVHQMVDDHKVQMHHKQNGDPNKLLDLLLKLVEYKGDDFPTHVVAGPDAYENANKKIALIQKELSDWEHIATKTDLDHA
eukprot:gene11125-13620_t